ncbi:hypothetical protein ACH35V_30670 [Actinomadura sp. 1N219]|uniref:aromatic-ring hydroxylase C-terminal domain-containing protein n=1 Tax=Actinomadura sp. 1N219 TaxID=3375152 RepID=UPI0037BD8871
MRAGRLDTYREERLPVARQIVERASRSNATLGPIFQALQLPPTPGADDLNRALDELEAPVAAAADRREALQKALQGTLICFNAHGVETNQHYRSAAIVGDGLPEPQAPRDEEIHHFATTAPGRHLPHVWLTRDQRRVSTLDLCGRGEFTLITRIRGTAWRDAAERAAAELGVPLAVRGVGRGCDYEDAYGDFADISEIDEDGALLVRPDLMVAWRSKTTGDDPAATLINVLCRILGRATAPSVVSL